MKQELKDLLNQDHDKLITGMRKGIEKLNEDAKDQGKEL